MITFDDLNLSKPLLKALNDIDFKNPTPVQEKAFPIIMSGKDAVGIAQTGTGKNIRVFNSNFTPIDLFRNSAIRVF